MNRQMLIAYAIPIAFIMVGGWYTFSALEAYGATKPKSQAREEVPQP